MDLINKCLYKKNYNPENFIIGEGVRIYITPRGKRHTERETREGNVLDIETEIDVVKSKDSSLKLCVYKIGRFINGKLETEDKRYVGKYLYYNIKFVEFLDRKETAD